MYYTKTKNKNYVYTQIGVSFSAFHIYDFIDEFKKFLLYCLGDLKKIPNEAGQCIYIPVLIDLRQNAIFYLKLMIS